MDKVIVIAGPTASGKTSLSIELAKKINGEIISQLRLNYENQICSNSEIDSTFNGIIENYPSKICDKDWGYDLIF